MKRYEYQTFDITADDGTDRGGGAAATQKRLSALGDDGWLLVAVINGGLAIFVREVPA